jgi:uroporphyrinogen decarboxylase
MYGFWEDMCYKTGPLISPEFVKRYMFPRYRRVVDFLHSRGVKWISLDSDGNITSLIPIWLEAGINFIYPFEVQAGMDVVKVRKTFGKELRMMGGIDKRAIAEGPSAIDDELKRVSPVLEEGGYIPAPDHSLPPDVSFNNYCYYMEKLKKLVEERHI